jgi:uncharacterized protein YndB with AHSA1/START domain
LDRGHAGERGERVGRAEPPRVADLAEQRQYRRVRPNERDAPCGVETRRRQQVARGFEAVSTVAIDAPKAKVWDALTNPAKVKQYMHGTNLTTDSKVGSPIAWKGEWKGKSYVDKGTVLEVEPEKLLKYTHWSPMGGSADKPENYHAVTCELAEKGGKTILTLTQDNNATQEEADKMAADNWGPMLEGLKETAEK